MSNEWNLKYWRTGEWQVIKERLRNETQYNPPHRLLFAALRAVHPGACRVAILGQDPYPQRKFCVGHAFSIPGTLREFPPTLINIFKEYEDDLGYPAPSSGDLTPWCEQGVLLWNVYPSCAVGKPGSHHWEEWTWLTKEIVEKLNERGMVFVMLGRVARSFVLHTDSRSCIIETSHPSPLGANRGFFGSKIFSRTNEELVKMGKEPIDWRL